MQKINQNNAVSMWRAEIGWTQDRLATELGVSVRTVRNLETRGAPVPKQTALALDALKATQTPAQEQTMDDPRGIILALVKAHGINCVEDQAMRVFNTERAHVSEDGDIFIASPCTGHWLNDIELSSAAQTIAQFIDFYG